MFWGVLSSRAAMVLVVTVAIVTWTAPVVAQSIRVAVAGEAPPLQGAHPARGLFGLSDCVQLPGGGLPPRWEELPITTISAPVQRATINYGSTLSEFIQMRSERAGISGQYAGFSGDLSREVIENRALSQFSEFVYATVYSHVNQHSIRSVLTLTDDVKRRFFSVENLTGAIKLTDPIGFEQLCGTHIAVGAVRGAELDMLLRFERSTNLSQSDMRAAIRLTYSAGVNSGTASAAVAEAMTRLEQNSTFQQFSRRVGQDTPNPTSAREGLDLVRNYVADTIKAGEHRVVGIVFRPYSSALPGVDFAGGSPTSAGASPIVIQRLGSLLDLIGGYEYVYKRTAEGAAMSEFEDNLVAIDELLMTIQRFRIEFEQMEEKLKECLRGLREPCKELNDWANDYWETHPPIPSRSSSKSPSVRETFLQPIETSITRPGLAVVQWGGWCFKGACQEVRAGHQTNCIVIKGITGDGEWALSTSSNFLVPPGYHIYFQRRNDGFNIHEGWNDRSYGIRTFVPIAPANFVRFDPSLGLSSNDAFKQCLPAR